MNSIVNAVLGGLIAGSLSLACGSSSSGTDDGSNTNTSGMATFACNIPDEYCETQKNIPEVNISTDQQACMSMGGTVVTDCTSSGPYAGCCSGTSTTGGIVDSCFYAAAGETETDCTTGGGTWTAQ